MEIEPESEVVIAVPTSRTIYPKTSGTLSFVKLFFYQCPTGMQGSGFVILCLCLSNFAALVGNSKPVLIPAKTKAISGISFSCLSHSDALDARD